jgi:hypothetical protein
MTKDIKPWNCECPVCKNKHAYMGFNKIDCYNEYCKNYNFEHAQTVRDYKNKKAGELLDANGQPNYDNYTNNDEREAYDYCGDYSLFGQGFP